MPDRTRSGKMRAGGAVVWKPGPDGPVLALIHRPKYGDWTLPKGKCEPGEHVLLAAVREVAEETGLRVDPGQAARPVPVPGRGQDEARGLLGGDQRAAG